MIAIFLKIAIVSQEEKNLLPRASRFSFVSTNRSWINCSEMNHEKNVPQYLFMYFSPRFRLVDWDVQRWKRDNQWQRSFYTAYRPITTAVSCRSQQSIGGHECAVDGALSRDGRGHGSQTRVLQGGIVLLCPIQLVVHNAASYFTQLRQLHEVHNFYSLIVYNIGLYTQKSNRTNEQSSLSLSVCHYYGLLTSATGRLKPLQRRKCELLSNGWLI